MVKQIIAGFILIVLLTGCLKDPKASDDADCVYDACVFKAPATEIQDVQNYLAANGITNFTQHCSGLFYIIDQAGSGTQPNACSYVTVHFKGSLTDGTVFQEADYGTFLDRVIPGWTKGIPQIKEGGKIRLFVPPTLGYGAQPYGSIPANSILIFEIELFDVQ